MAVEEKKSKEGKKHLLFLSSFLSFPFPNALRRRSRPFFSLPTALQRSLFVYVTVSLSPCWSASEEGDQRWLERFFYFKGRCNGHH